MPRPSIRMQAIATVGVLMAAVLPDGRVLATGSDDQTAQVWEAATGRSVEEALVHQGPIRGVAFGTDGRTLLTRSPPANTTISRRVGDGWETSVGVGWQSTGRVWALPAPVEDDAAAYRDACTHILQRFGGADDPMAVATVVWTCSVAPGATTDAEQLIRPANRVCAQDTQDYAAERGIDLVARAASQSPPSPVHRDGFATASRIFFPSPAAVGGRLRG